MLLLLILQMMQMILNHHGGYGDDSAADDGEGQHHSTTWTDEKRTPFFLQSSAFIHTPAVTRHHDRLGRTLEMGRRRSFASRQGNYLVLTGLNRAQVF